MYWTTLGPEFVHALEIHKQLWYCGTAILFLELNDIKATFAEDLYEDLVVEIAKGNYNKGEIAYFLEHGTLPYSKPPPRKRKSKNRDVGHDKK